MAFKSCHGIIPLMDNIAIAMVGVVTAIAGLFVAARARRVTYYGASTDNMKWVYTASLFGQWRWPSHMHKCVEGGFRTFMKDGYILGLVAAQRLLRDRTSDFPTVILCLTANSISAVLTYFIASAYWNISAALLVWALLIVSLWSYKLALFGTHQCVAQMYFLASIFFIQMGETNMAWYAAAGVSAGLTFFSSPSARKYFPLVVAALFFSQRAAIWEPDFVVNLGRFTSETAGPMILGFAVVLVSVALLARFAYRPVVAKAYNLQRPGWLARKFASRRRHSLEVNQGIASELSKMINSFCLGLALYALVTVPVVHAASFYWSQLTFVLGAGGLVLFLTAPNVPWNLWGFYRYSQGWKYNRFSLYQDYFASIGRPIKDDMRGGGIVWITRFFVRIAPIHAALYLASLFLLAGLLIAGHLQLEQTWQAAAIFLLSISPVLYGEITHNAPSSRTYYPGLIGALLLVGYTAFQLNQVLTPTWQTTFWAVAAAATLAALAWSAWIFTTDVLPARMSVARLSQALQSLDVEDFYTFDTPYNDAFVYALPAEELKRYKVHYITSLEEVTEGYVVVPCTSSKAMHMESTGWAIEHGDFDEDQELSRLIKSKEITEYAVASFKTFGSSRFWSQSYEVPTYRDLILKEITEEDRWRGRAWILDAGKLQAAQEA